MIDRLVNSSYGHPFSRRLRNQGRLLRELSRARPPWAGAKLPIPRRVDLTPGRRKTSRDRPYANPDEGEESQSPPKRLGRAKWGSVRREITYNMVVSSASVAPIPLRGPRVSR